MFVETEIIFSADDSGTAERSHCQRFLNSETSLGETMLLLPSIADEEAAAGVAYADQCEQPWAYIIVTADLELGDGSFIHQRLRFITHQDVE